MKPIAFLSALLVFCLSCAFADPLGILELSTIDDSTRADMHDALAACGFTLQRPLVGRLADQGNLWTTPEGMKLADAVALAESLDGVLAAVDMNVCADPAESSPLSYAVPGLLRIITGGGPPCNPEIAMAGLRSKGFEYPGEQICGRSYYRYYPQEYTLQEAVAAARSASCVTGVHLTGRGFYAKAHGVQYAGLIEDGSLTDEGRAQLYARLAERRFIYARPLLGHYVGQGSLWVVPYVGYFTASVQGIPEVKKVLNLHQCIIPGECYAYDFMPGELMVYSTPGSEWTARRGLQDGGMMMLSEDHAGFETWTFLGGEFTMAEAARAVMKAPGVTGVEPNVIFYPETFGDTNGDYRVNIADLINVRSCLGQCVTSSSCDSADVNRDWRIDILDLIIVRNELMW